MPAIWKKSEFFSVSDQPDEITKIWKLKPGGTLNKTEKTFSLQNDKKTRKMTVMTKIAQAKAK